MTYLNLEEFRASARRGNVATVYGDLNRLEIDGLIYASGCGMISLEGEKPYLVIENCDWQDTLANCEKLLWALHYLPECESVILDENDGTLDHWLQARCLSSGRECDGDLFALFFSDSRKGGKWTLEEAMKAYNDACEWNRKATDFDARFDLEPIANNLDVLARDLPEEITLNDLKGNPHLARVMLAANALSDLIGRDSIDWLKSR